ncbi:tail fiber domain-containing protein [Leisingera sp. XS_AS12]|uniref:tail fiber domain-containing protein n=1 Tax=Leisingera sp. XS_AS12 TaxID=3241294 RepID=UPI003512A4C0
MKRKIKISLVASTALAAVLAQPAIASGRSDGSDVNSLNNPSFDAYTSTNGSGDNLGSHIATRDLNMDGYSIFNLADPTNPLDAISLKYLQTYVSANGDNLGNHVATQAINMNGFGIFQVPAPSGPTHAVNRAYVDTAVAGAGDDLGNHIATQNLNMSNRRVINVAAPVNGADAVNYSFLQTYVTANGDHLGNHSATRNLDMGGFKIEDLLDPVDPQDAASKSYVDASVKSTQDDVDDLKAIRIDTGTGLNGGGDLSQNRTISFDTSWGDGRYALRSRQVIAGTGLTGGGSLAGNRTISFDISWGDNRYALRTRQVAAGTGLTGGGTLAANRTISFDLAWGDNRFVNNAGNETISGTKTFTGPVIVNAPTAGNQAANKSYVDAAAAAAKGTTYSAGTGLTLAGTTFNFDTTWGDARYAVRWRTINTGSGLVGGGNLTANRTLSVDSTVVRTSGNQSLSGVKTFTGELRSFRNSNSPGGNIRFGRDAAQYMTFHGGSSGHFLTGISPDGQNKPLYVRLQSGSNSRNFVFRINGTLGGLANPISSSDAATKSYVDAKAASAPGTTYTSGTGLRLSGTTFSFDTGYGDGRYAMRGRTISAGVGLTGGGNLAGNRTIAFDVGWGDGRFVNLTGNETIDGSKKFIGSVLVPDPGGPNQATNKRYVDGAVGAFTAGTGLTKSGQEFSFDTTWGDARYVRPGRRINTGPGLTGGGNLTANRTITPTSMLAALQGLSGSNTGIIVKRSGDVVATRTIGGGFGIDVSNGNGVNGNPSIALASNHRRKGASDSSAGVMKYNGNAKANGQFYGGNSNPSRSTRLNYDGHLYATAFYSSAYYYFSDRNLKKDIETVQAADGMKIVRDLNPVTYSWKATGEQAYGVIAQEIEAVMPTAVRTNAAGTKAVDYLQIISPMLAAIQELDERVQTLEDALQ